MLLKLLKQVNSVFGMIYFIILEDFLMAVTGSVENVKYKISRSIRILMTF
jgi:hypothetical protein